MLINPVNLSYMGRPGLTPLPPIPGVSRVEVLPVLGFVLSGDLSVGHHLTDSLGSCSRSLYAVRILKAHGLPTSFVLARLLYAASAWRGFATAQDCSRIDRFINRTVDLGYLPAHCQTFDSLVNTAEAIGCSPPLFATHTTFSARSSFLFSPDGLASASELNPFTLPLKDDKQCIPRVLYRSLLPPVQSYVCFPCRFFSIPYNSFNNNYLNLALSSSIVLLAPVNSCELHNYYLVLSLLVMYSSSGLSTDVCFLIKRI